MLQSTPGGRSLTPSATSSIGSMAPEIPAGSASTAEGILRLSLSSAQEEGNGDSQEASSSAEGRWVAFQSRAGNLVPGDTNHVQDVFVRDRVSGETRRVSVASDGTEANKDSGKTSISADGRLGAFESKASNLVSGDTNRRQDVFVHERLNGETGRGGVAG